MSWDIVENYSKTKELIQFDLIEFNEIKAKVL